jgi:fatty acid-binding protein DegV
MIERRHAESPLRCYAVVHGRNPDGARELAAKIEQAIGLPPLYIEEISPVLALHAGRGTVAVATMQE